MQPPIEAEGLVNRAAAILFKPIETWTRILGETTPVRRIFLGYVMVLGAINPICFGLGRLLFGERVLGVVYRPAPLAVLAEGVFSYALVLAFVWVLALLIQALASPFGASRDRAAAFRIAAYSGTAGWLASVFYLVPAVGVLALIGQFYTLFLLYLGIRIVLRPQGRTVGYVALVVVSYVVLTMLVISLTKLLAALA